MEAEINTLFRSDFYRILDFKCRCTDCIESKPEYSDSFSISFVRKGNFLFNVFRNKLDSYTGCVLITKPGAERTVSHIHEVPDECTIFEFKKNFYELLTAQYPDIRFFKNEDIHSTLIKTSPETEFLHYSILKKIISKTTSRLEVDMMVLDLIAMSLGKISDYKPEFAVYDQMKKNHLITIELAKEFIANHFAEDISLRAIARHSRVSMFHFSRIFKKFTSFSPHQFLLSIRLKNAEVLLKTTTLNITDIAYQSGFSHSENFTNAFRNKYRTSPSKYRSQVEAMD